MVDEFGKKNQPNKEDNLCLFQFLTPVVFKFEWICLYILSARQWTSLLSKQEISASGLIPPLEAPHD